MVNNQKIYHQVSLRDDLSIIDRSYPEEIRHDLPPNDYWLKKLPVENHYEIHYSRVNGPYTTLDDCHPILTAFLRAYNSHEDMILSPDDIWLMVSIYFADYLNEQAHEQNSHFYLDDQTSKILTIENDQNDWPFFLHQIQVQMTSHIKTDLCHLLINRFSTTTDVESLLSSIVLMSTFKKCFTFNVPRSSCGIRHVQFLGTLDDWNLLREKTNQLQQWTKENDQFYLYLQGILPIFDQFIQTYQGNVDQQFWDTIFDLNHQNDQSTLSDGVNINGWFLRLCYGSAQKSLCSLSDIQLNSVIVPVRIDNEEKNISTTSYLLGGFHGVDSFDGKHRPVLSLMIVEDRTNVTNFVEE